MAGDATVVLFNEEMRARGAARSRLRAKGGSGIALGVSARAGAKAEQALDDFARASVAVHVGKLVRAARKSQGYSQEELAKLVGVTQARISQWENMEKSGETIDIVNLFKIALVCNFSLRLDWNERPPRETGSRRKAQPVHEKQEGSQRNDQSRHDRGEM
jgi:transcriptional regulator with XRE-family HTH domain